VTKPVISDELYRVLLVDDDDHHRGLLRHILDETAYRIEEAASGQEALATMDQSGFDVILLDYELSDMTGLEICRAIRVVPTFDHVPIIIVTGRNDPIDAVECLRAGANDFINKPYHTTVLEARVRGLAERKRLIDRLLARR
jgi:DNA-binding response OmpR family regulator